MNNTITIYFPFTMGHFDCFLWMRERGLIYNAGKLYFTEYNQKEEKYSYACDIDFNK